MQSIENQLMFQRDSWLAYSSACHLLSCSSFAWLILWPWWWRQYVPQKHKLTFNRLHGIISQKILLFIATAVRNSNPTHLDLACPPLITTTQTTSLQFPYSWNGVPPSLLRIQLCLHKVDSYTTDVYSCKTWKPAGGQNALINMGIL
jgi:hypothetical protein